MSPTKKVYIGQSIDILDRIRRYKKLKCKSQTYLYNSLKKYSWEKHDFELLCQCDKSELDNLEKYYIELFQSFNSEFGLNLREGGSHTRISKEQKEKTSKALKGKKHSEERKKNIKIGLSLRSDEDKERARQKNSESHKGKIPWNKGLPSPRKGIKLSKETKLKQSISKKGHIVSAETRLKISKTLKLKKSKTT